MPKATCQATQKPPVELKPRKHFSQMSPDEVLCVTTFARNHIKQVRIALHALERSKGWAISAGEAYDAIQKGKLVEVSNTNGQIRALFRSDLGICVVLSLSTWDMITTYYNSPEDEHITLDKSRYTWKADLEELVGRLANGH